MHVFAKHLQDLNTKNKHPRAKREQANLTRQYLQGERKKKGPRIM
jgi:hypothetical protein